MRTRSAFGLSLLLLAACSGSNVTIPEGDVTADVQAVVTGVEDESRDTAVLGVRSSGGAYCAGVLVASDVLLTARHCVQAMPAGVSCPMPAPVAEASADVAPASIEVVSGETVPTAVFVAAGRALVVPATDDVCASDIALLLLDRPVPGVPPLEVSQVAVLPGERVRTVGFGLPDAAVSLTKIFREHVPVLGQTPTELTVRESSCGTSPGGPALDESTGAVVGVFSRIGEDCAGEQAQDVFIRADAFWSLIETALAERLGGQAEPGAAIDAGAHSVKLATDYGDTCQLANQCAAGVCVDDGEATYCSRTCDGQDECPTSFRCAEARSGAFACVARSP